METLIKMAMEALGDSLMNEITLTDGQMSVRVVRSTPTIWYSTPVQYNPPYLPY